MTNSTKQSPNRILAGVVTGYFMVQLALVPVAAMLPTLAKEFDVDIGLIGWIMTIYLLSLTGFQLFGGRMGDQISHQSVFKAGLVVFGLSSLMAGLSWSYWQLIVWRALQGVGAAMLAGNSMAIVHKAFESRDRGKAIGWLTSAAAFGSLLGIIIGSLFTQYLSWRFVFFLGIPLSLISLFLLKGKEERTAEGNWRNIDFPGGIMLYLLLVCFSMSFASGHKGHGGNGEPINPVVSVSSFIRWEYLAAMVICFALLVWIEKRSSNPLVIFNQFKNKRFTGAVSANFILHFVMICVVFFIPFIVEQGLGETAIFTAAVLLSVEFMNAIFPPIASSFYHRYNWHWLRPFGMGVIATGLCAYYLLVDHTGVPGLILLGGWIGFGMGVFWSINNHVIMTSLDDEYRGFASGMLETTRQSGHTLASGISAVAMGYALNQQHIENISILDSLYVGAKYILLIGTVSATVGLLFTFLKNKSQEKPIQKEESISAEI